MAQRSAFAQSSRCEPGGFRWRWLLCAHLRQKCGKSVGGLGLSRGTSDGNTGKVSEVQDFRGVPQTEMREKCRRSRTFEGYLRRKHGNSVGGPGQRMFTRAASNLESQTLGHRNSQKPSTDFPKIPLFTMFLLSSHNHIINTYETPYTHRPRSRIDRLRTASTRSHPDRRLDRNRET